MRVVLKSNWFGPDCHLYVKNVAEGTEVPDVYADVLPPGTVPFAAPAEVEPAADANTLRDFDEVRIAGDLEQAKLDDAEAVRLQAVADAADKAAADAAAKRAANAKKLADELAAEKGSSK